jgi:hypothetical protein
MSDTFTLYNPVGKIVAVITCKESELHSNMEAHGATGYLSGFFHWNQYRISDGAAVEFPARPSLNHTWNWCSLEWEDQRPLEAIKVSKMVELKAVRDSSLATFTWDGSVFDSDPNSKINLLGLYTASQAPEFSSETWRLADNSWRVLDASDVSGVWAALQVHVRTCFGRFAMAEAAVMSATTAEEVAAVEF